jgi:F-type H+/Na+-transporting ATPase subunit alpha
LETGVSVVDLMVPLGLGQRELVLGDRKTGKSEFLMQVLLSQVRSGSICIYACVGKRKSDVKRLEEFVKRNELTDNTCMVVTSSTDPTALIMLTPYYALTLAEYFRDTG